MTKGRCDDILDSQVEVRARRHDDCILSACLGMNREVLPERAKQFGSLVRTSEDDAANPLVGNQFAAERIVVKLYER